jgi:hypothetical protein
VHQSFGSFGDAVLIEKIVEIPIVEEGVDKLSKFVFVLAKFFG